MARAVLLIVVLIPATTWAGTSAPNSHLIPSRDGTTVLVMISSEAPYDQVRDVTLPDGRLVNLRQTFAGSGLYDVATLKPVWRVQWFSFPWELQCSDDLRHVVRLNPKGFPSRWALASTTTASSCARTAATSSLPA